jgi:hypothetical protein
MAWIKTDEKKPNKFNTVLLFCKDDRLMTEGFLNDEDKWVSGYANAEINGVTHWMPMPYPPTE